MNATLESLGTWSAFVLELWAKSTVLLLAAFAMTFLLRRRPAPLRCAIWNVAILSLLGLPLLSAFLPQWSMLPVNRIVPPLEQSHDVVALAEPAPPPKVLESDDAAEAFNTVAATDNTPRLTSTALPAHASTYVQQASAALVLVAIAGAMFGLLKLFLDLGAVRRLRRTSLPVMEGSWSDRLAVWAERMQLSSALQLSHSEHVSVPLVLGVFRPIMFLPTTFVPRNEVHFMDAVLNHELAHVRRRDYAWQLVFRIVRALYWYQPLAWAMERPLGLAREQACDHFAAHCVGDTDCYASALLEVARSLAKRPILGLGLAFARRSTMATRLASLANHGGNSSYSLTRTRAAQCYLAGLMIAALVATLQLQADTADAQVADAPPIEADPPATRSNVANPPQPSPLPDGALLELGNSTFRQQGECKGIAYSPDGKLLATTDDTSVVIWDASTGQRKEVWDAGDSNLSVEALAFAPQGHRVAACLLTGTIRIRDIRTQQVVETPPLKNFSPFVMQDRGISFSPDGSRLASTFSQQLSIYDTSTGELIRGLDGIKQGKPGRDLAWTSDGKHVAFCSFNPPAQLWDTTTGELVRAFNPGERTFSISMAISPDGKTLAAGCIRQGRGETMIYMWDLATGEQKAKLPSEDAVSVSFTPDSKLLVSATEMGRIQI